MSKDLSSSLSERVLRAFFVTLGSMSLFFLGQILGILIVISVMQIFGYGTEDISTLLTENVEAQFLAMLIVQTITVGLLYSVYRYAKKPFRKSIGLLGLPKGLHILRALQAYALYFLSFLYVVTLISRFMPGININQMQQLGFDSPAGIELVFVFATVVILPSIAEEIIFRGFLYKQLRKIISLKSAVIVTSLVFGAAHLEFLSDAPLNWIAAIDTAIFSIFLVWAYVKSGSLWAPILLHGLKNSIAFVVLFII